MNKTFVFFIIYFVLAVLCGGCQLNPLVKPAQAFMDTAGKEYLEYVEKDITLDNSSKRARRANVEAFRMLIEEAQNE